MLSALPDVKRERGFPIRPYPAHFFYHSTGELIVAFLITITDTAEGYAFE